MDYAIDSEKWPGTAKVMEESGELVQVLGKLMSVDGADIHFDGSDMKARMIEEIGDLAAALIFFVEVNGLDGNAIDTRVKYKTQLYWGWRQGRDV
jgi:NTP pyrophosphatase (non-canonical NTP hydrolase)